MAKKALRVVLKIMVTVVILVLLFVQAHHPVVEQWIAEHEQQIANSTRSEMVLLEANHYLYRSHPQEIAEGIRIFMKNE